MKSHARKVGVALVGFPLLILGLILIPLPGPGLLVSALGLAVLSLEFEWAERHLNTVKRKMSEISEKIRNKTNKENSNKTKK